MSVVNLGKIKALLSITDNTYDSIISTLIPIVQEDMLYYLNNGFQDENIKYESANISIVRGTPDTITDADSQFVNYNFAVGMDILVEGGGNTNFGVYTLEGVAAGTLTLNTNNTVRSQTYNDNYTSPGTIKISMINWPMGIEWYFAQMIWFNIDRTKVDDIKSKSLGPSSITYRDLQSGGYPSIVLNGLKKWKLLKAK